MKKSAFFFLFCLCFNTILADTIIQMEEYGGVYRIPCIVNGAKMKFIFDTGASNVCLSLSMAEYLYDNDFIDDTDIIGVGKSSVADGRIVDHIKINLKDIQIGDVHIYNVEAVVIDGQNAPLLMGLSAIRKLGSVEINGNMLIIHNDNDDSYYEHIDALIDNAKDAYERGLYDKAISYFEQLPSIDVITDYAKLVFARCYYYENKPEKALNVLSKIEDYDYFEENDIDIYRLYSLCYSTARNYSKAVDYMKLSIERMPTTNEELVNKYYYIGDYYYFDSKYRFAVEWYSKSVDQYALNNGISREYMLSDCMGYLKKNQISYRNEKIDDIFFQLMLCSYYNGELSSIQFAQALDQMSNARNKSALKYKNSIYSY